MRVFGVRISQAERIARAKVADGFKEQEVLLEQSEQRRKWVEVKSRRKPDARSYRAWRSLKGI